MLQQLAKWSQPERAAGAVDILDGETNHYEIAKQPMLKPLRIWQNYRPDRSAIPVAMSMALKNYIPGCC
jgi:hypothetical protein